MNTDYALYLDLDGVLVDFENGALRAARTHTSRDITKPTATVEFWANLDWIQGGKELWDASKNLYKNIMILSSGGTSDPEVFSKVAKGKIEWCKKNLLIPEDDIMIVQGRHLKKVHSHRMGILVDNNEENIAEWEKEGGTGILHHHKFFQRTIEELEILAKPIDLEPR